MLFFTLLSLVLFFSLLAKDDKRLWARHKFHDENQLFYYAADTLDAPCAAGLSQPSLD